ncbi:MAG TPA: leucine zipper domain-containing protein [Stellaceae bacterium]|nr:leucine zipper domain-containing protein [Stellaceae bacterium]
MTDESVTGPRDIAAGERGLIIQRVLVDGWSARQAGAVHGVDERLVLRWLAAYRRCGMASLHDDANERGARRWLGRLRLWMARLMPGRRPSFGRAAAPCIVLRRGLSRHTYHA